jgi:hypothetical protein
MLPSSASHSPITCRLSQSSGWDVHWQCKLNGLNNVHWIEAWDQSHRPWIWDRMTMFVELPTRKYCWSSTCTVATSMRMRNFHRRPRRALPGSPVTMAAPQHEPAWSPLLQMLYPMLPSTKSAAGGGVALPPPSLTLIVPVFYLQMKPPQWCPTRMGILYYRPRCTHNKPTDFVMLAGSMAFQHDFDCLSGVVGG